MFFMAAIVIFGLTHQWWKLFRPDMILCFSANIQKITVDGFNLKCFWKKEERAVTAAMLSVIFMPVFLCFKSVLSGQFLHCPHRLSHLQSLVDIVWPWLTMSMSDAWLYHVYRMVDHCKSLLMRYIIAVWCRQSWFNNC